MMILQAGYCPARNRSAKSAGARAFTLIELILVMALLMIVLALSASSLGRFFHGRVLDSEARRFVSLTRYGQSRAVSEGVPMVLWLDTKLGAYGLQQETGYNPVDAKAVDYQLGQDLLMEVAAAAPQIGQNGMARQTAHALPMIRFLPDGFISEVSVRSVWIREKTGETIRIAQTINGLNYEISSNAQPGY